MAGKETVIKIVGEFTDKISPELSKLTTNNIPALMGALAALVGVKVAQFMAEMTREAINVGAAFTDMSKRTGVAVETLSGLSVAAKFGGTDINELADGMKDLSEKIADAQDKTSDQAILFKKLGIETKDSSGKLRNVNDVMGDLADQFSKTANDANKIKIAMELMGDAGVKLIPVLNGGRKALKEYEDLAKVLGLLWTEEQSAQATKFNDSLNVMVMAVDGFWQIIAKDLLPRLSDMADYLSQSVKEGGLLRNILDGLAALISGPVGAAFDFLATIASTIALSFQVAGKAIGGVAAGLVAMLSGDLKAAKAIMAEMADDIKKQYNDYAEFNGKIWNRTEDTSTKTELPTIGSTGIEEAKKAEEFEKALAGLQKELFAVNSAGKEIDVTWQTMHGEFKDFTKTQKQMLISKGIEIDITKELLALETQRVKVIADREKRLTEVWTATSAESIQDKYEREGWLAAEQFRITKMAEFAQKEIEIRKLGPVAQKAILEQMEKDKAAISRGGEQWQEEREAGIERAKSIEKGQIWHDTLIQNADAQSRLTAEVRQYGVMLKIGDISQERYNELMVINKRATEELAASQSRSTMAYYEVTKAQTYALEDLKIKEEAINQAFKDGNITLAEKKLRLKEVKDEMDNMNPVFTINQVEKLEDTIKSASASFEGMFSDYLFNAMEGKWQNLGDMIRKQISSMIAQMMAARIQMALFGDMGSTPSGKTANSTGLLGGLFSSVFGGFRENGGDVTAGKAYIVGEKRPEVFVPSTNGSIISSVDKLAGGDPGVSQMQINISALDGSDVMRVLSSRKRELAQMMNSTNRAYNLG